MNSTHVIDYRCIYYGAKISKFINTHINTEHMDCCLDMCIYMYIVFKHVYILKLFP